MPPWLEEVLARALERLCVPDHGDLPAPAESGALEAALGFISGMPPATREEFQAMLALLEYSPYAFGPRRQRFSRLGDDDVDRLLVTLESSSLLSANAMFKALKAASMMGYWSRPGTWGGIGYSLDENPGVPEDRR
ncbi:hypothetical protein DL240_08440 [Lujinxingia litoralis]|uniref:Gluconate 2-dehydrogenase subunit 3 family protein n=2 Tax=Lujinxingia litoralis TaxID=2211119 RepID=A0A328C8B0_9DELT|nr:hypothetical protein DL240_08440 [Lujinxingia litoralis]